MCRNPLICLLVLLCLLLPSCSALKLSYNKAPELISWWLDSYLDFSDGQRQLLRPQLATLHAWHRREELPQYAQMLQGWQRQLRDDITPAQVCTAYDEIRGHMRVLNAHMAPIALALAPSLSAQQLAHLQQRFDKRNRKWREEWMQGTLEERRQHRLEESVKRAEMLYGSLSDAQLGLLKAGIASSSFDPQITYRELLRREQDAHDVLAAIRDKNLQGAQAEAEVRAYFERLMQSPDAGYRRNLETITQESCNMVAELHNSTSAGQRAQARESLQRYIDDFRILGQAEQKQ